MKSSAIGHDNNLLKVNSWKIISLFKACKELIKSKLVHEQSNFFVTKNCHFRNEYSKGTDGGLTSKLMIDDNN